mmetsp:Transcript_6292/g.11216  ORF Transcript_6292/g.11216 Transcript_6292/m.11216 type:complete len:358 (+) Transcript_6292:145-1218(+)
MGVEDNTKWIAPKTRIFFLILATLVIGLELVLIFKSSQTSCPDAAALYPATINQKSDQMKLHHSQSFTAFTCVLDQFVFDTVPDLHSMQEDNPRLPYVSIHAANKPKHLLGIVIPYRSRWSHLVELRAELGEFLRRNNIEYRFFIVNQSDAFRFNRGALMNVGVKAAFAYGCDYVALHDIDLVPLRDIISYGFPEEGAYHATPNGVHPVSKFPKYYGGVHLMRISSYVRINGFCNLYWGWGAEDTDFFRRVSNASMEYSDFVMTRPPLKGTKGAFKHIGEESHARDKRTHGINLGLDCPREIGYSNVEYSCEKVYHENSLNDVIFIDTQLNCDRKSRRTCKAELKRPKAKDSALEKE